MRGDFRSAWRQFVRRPLLAALVALLLAIGVGANVLIFGLIDTLLLKPLPVRDPGNLWVLESVRERQVQPSLGFSYGQFELLAKRGDLFSGITAEQEWGGAAAYPAGEDGLHSVMTQMVAPNYFTEMGVRAALGRVLNEQDAGAGPDIPALLSFQFWQANYGGRRDILGRTIRIKNYPFRIVGVLPQEFHSIDIERAPDVRLPISAAPILEGRAVNDPRGEEYREGFRILARLRRGVGPGAIEAAAGAEVRHFLESEFLLRNASASEPLPPAMVEASLRWFDEGRLALEPIGEGISRLRTQFARALRLLMSGVIVLLVAVCANVAGLLLARGEERRKELALRLAVGATRAQVWRQLMVENLCLALPGGAAGVLLAYAAAPLLLRVLPPVRSLDQYASPAILSVTPNMRTLLFAWLAVVVSVCFFGLFPAWRATRLEIAGELKVAAGAMRGAADLTPVIVQIALSVLLLAAGGLTLRTYWNLEHLNPGFDRGHVVSFTLSTKDSGLTPAQANGYLTELELRMRQLPGVRSSALSSHGLMRGSGIKTTLTAAGVNQPAKVFLNASFVNVTPSYFDTLGIPFLAGHNLDAHEARAKPQRVVINQALAQLLFSGKDPIGQAIVEGNDGSRPPTYVVAGLVATAKYRQMREPAPPTFYAPLTDPYDPVLYVRTEGAPRALIRPAEEAIRKMGRGVTLREAATLEQEVQNSLWQERLVAGLASFFSGVALLVASIGLYGALAYSVARRKRELGIRIAIGARVGHILGAVCGRMSWAVGLGLALGLASAALALRLARSFLFEVDPLDKLSLGGAALAVLLSACLAAMAPSWRAIRTDAAGTLREQ